jgi:hypothetical protein
MLNILFFINFNKKNKKPKLQILNKLCSNNLKQMKLNLETQRRREEGK